MVIRREYHRAGREELRLAKRGGNSKTRRMKTSLDHLPLGKRRELEHVVQVIQDAFRKAIANRRADGVKDGQILKIILYGSYARGDWVEDPSPPLEQLRPTIPTWEEGRLHQLVEPTRVWRTQYTLRCLGPSRATPTRGMRAGRACLEVGDSCYTVDGSTVSCKGWFDAIDAQVLRWSDQPTRVVLPRLVHPSSCTINPQSVAVLKPSAKEETGYVFWYWHAGLVGEEVLIPLSEEQSHLLRVCWQQKGSTHPLARDYQLHAHHDGGPTWVAYRGCSASK